MPKSKIAYPAVVMLAITLVALTYPFVIADINDDQTEQKVQDEGVSVRINGDINSTVKNVTSTSATVELTNSEERNATIDVGNTTTITVHQDSIDVTMVSTDKSDKQATVKYEFEPLAGFGEQAQTLLSLIPELLVLLALALIGWSFIGGI